MAKKVTAPGEPQEGLIEHDGKKYLCNIPQFEHGGKVYTAEELADKPKLVAELVELGFGGLVEQK
jgi:hypothetical protein